MPVTAVLIVDEIEFPVDLSPGSITGEHVVAMRSLNVSPESLAEVVAVEDIGTVEFPEVVALMALSLTQRDLPCDVAWLARHLRTDADVSVRSELRDRTEAEVLLAASQGPATA